MKKYLIYALGLFLVFSISCTRSAVEKSSSGVVIQIPSRSELQKKSQKFSANNFVNSLIQKNGLQTLSSDPAPTGFDGARPLNCFGVILSGPTETLQRNHCFKKTTSTGAAVSFRAGILSAIVPAGGQIEMNDLENGPDRVFRLVGFHSKTGACPALQDSHDSYGNGYLMSEIGGVKLDGKDITIQMKMSFDSDKFVDRCEGPDFPEDNGGGGGGNPATRLAIKKDYFPVNQLIESTCQAVDIIGQNVYSNYASLKSTVTLKMLGNGTGISMYSSRENCMSMNSVTEMTITAGQDRKQIWFMGPAKNISSTLDLDISFASNPDGLTSVPLTGMQVRSYDELSFDIYAPERILAESCYEFKIDAKYMNNSIYSGHYSVTTVNITNGIAYSDASCTTQTNSVNFSMGKSSSPIYVKTAASPGTIVKIVASYGGFVDGEKNIEVGSGNSILSAIQIRYNNQTSIGDCVKASVTYLNENYTAINLPAATSLNLSGAGSVANFYSDQWCMNPIGGVHPVVSGSSASEFYFMPLTYGDQAVQVTSAGVTSVFDIRYFANYQYKLEVSSNSYIMQPGQCVGVTIYTQYQNGSYMYFSTPTTVSVASPFPIFSDSNCKTNMGSTAIVPANSNMIGFYFQPDNLTPIAINRNMSFQAAGLSPASISVQVSQRPAIEPEWSLTAHKIPSNYPLDMKLFKVPFTGIGPYTYTKTAGTGTLSGDIYSPVLAETAAFTIADSVPLSFNITAQTVQNITSNNFLAGQLPAGYSFARSSVAKYFDGSGTLVDSAAGTPRFDHDSDPATAFASIGLLIEPNSTNLTVFSSYLSAANWNKSFANVVASSVIQDPTGNSYSDTLEWDNPTYSNMAYASSQASMPSGGSTYSGSVFVKKDTARFVGMKIHEYGATYGYSGVVIDLDTGAVVGMNDPWSGDYSANFGVQKLKNGWFRIWTNYVAKGGSGIQLYLYPAYHGGSTLSPNRDNSAVGRTYFWGAQLEVNESVTSYIATTSTAASRSGDSFFVNLATSAAAYTSAAESTIRFEFSRPEGSRPTGGYIFTVCGSSCAAEKLSAKFYYGDSVGFDSLAYGGSDYRQLYSGNLASKNGINKMAVSVATDASHGFNWALNSTSGTSGTDYSSYHPNFNNGILYLGGDQNGLYQPGIHLRNYELWVDRISGPGLRTMTK